MLTITDTAAEAIKGIVASPQVPEGAGLRIATRPESPAEGAFEVSVAPVPAEEDQVVEESGAQVFLELHWGAGLRITTIPRPGDGYELELTPSPAPGANDRVVRGDDALVFVDPPVSAALEDALLDARIRAGRGPLRLPPSKLRPARGASSRPAGDTSGEHLPLARTRPPAPASLRDALLRQRARCRWRTSRCERAGSERPAGRRRAPARAPAVAGRPSSRASTRPRCGPGRFSPSYAPASGRALRGSRCRAASALRPASHHPHRVSRSAARSRYGRPPGLPPSRPRQPRLRGWF